MKGYNEPIGFRFDEKGCLTLEDIERQIKEQMKDEFDDIRVEFTKYCIYITRKERKTGSYQLTAIWWRLPYVPKVIRIKKVRK